MFSGIIFMEFFLDIAFLTMMASCLMFKILTGASSDIPRYQMLRKIGVRRELLRTSIYKELFFVFLFPAIVGVLYVIVGMNIFQGIILKPIFSYLASYSHLCRYLRRILLDYSSTVSKNCFAQRRVKI